MKNCTTPKILRPSEFVSQLAMVNVCGEFHTFTVSVSHTHETPERAVNPVPKYKVYNLFFQSI